MPSSSLKNQNKAVLASIILAKTAFCEIKIQEYYKENAFANSSSSVSVKPSGSYPAMRALK